MPVLEGLQGVTVFKQDVLAMKYLCGKMFGTKNHSTHTEDFAIRFSRGRTLTLPSIESI